MRLADPTVLTCWDADRLDLGRVGITPRAEKLCTSAACNPAVMAKANHRAEAWLEAYDARHEQRYL